MPALNLDTDADQIAERLASAGTLLVACLCAEWCGTCRDYREGFDLLADAHPDVCFAWIDIENQADRFGNGFIRIQHYPTHRIIDQAAGQAKTQLISLGEGVGKMKAALDGRSDATLVIMGRTGAASISGLEDTIARVKAYEATGVDALFLTGLKTHSELEAIAAATTLPIVLGGFPEELSDPKYLAGQRVRIALQGHAPFAAATQAVYETLKALRDGQSPKALKGLASSDLTGRVTRDANVKARSAEFLGLKG